MVTKTAKTKATKTATKTATPETEPVPDKIEPDFVPMSEDEIEKAIETIDGLVADCSWSVASMITSIEDEIVEEYSHVSDTLRDMLPDVSEAVRKRSGILSKWSTCFDRIGKILSKFQGNSGSTVPPADSPGIQDSYLTDRESACGSEPEDHSSPAWGKWYTRVRRWEGGLAID